MASYDRYDPQKNKSDVQTIGDIARKANTPLGFDIPKPDFGAPQTYRPGTPTGDFAPGTANQLENAVGQKLDTANMSLAQLRAAQPQQVQSAYDATKGYTVPANNPATVNPVNQVTQSVTQNLAQNKAAQSDGRPDKVDFNVLSQMAGADNVNRLYRNYNAASNLAVSGGQPASTVGGLAPFQAMVANRLGYTANGDGTYSKSAPAIDVNSPNISIGQLANGQTTGIQAQAQSSGTANQGTGTTNPSTGQNVRRDAYGNDLSVADRFNAAADRLAAATNQSPVAPDITTPDVNAIFSDLVKKLPQGNPGDRAKRRDILDAFQQSVAAAGLQNQSQRNAVELASSQNRTPKDNSLGYAKLAQDQQQEQARLQQAKDLSQQRTIADIVNAAGKDSFTPQDAATAAELRLNTAKYLQIPNDLRSQMKQGQINHLPDGTTWRWDNDSPVPVQIR